MEPFKGIPESPMLQGRNNDLKPTPLLPETLNRKLLHIKALKP